MGPGPHTVLACLAEPGRLGKQVVCPCFTPLPFSVELDAYGASLTCHVPRTYHEKSGVVRADKAGEAFTRQLTKIGKATLLDLPAVHASRVGSR